MLRLGILGLSEGNGHPYSWAAIFNGYDPALMATCPYPVIPEYLSRQSFPQDAINDARVTHIWTQDDQISQHIAQASRIDHIVDDYEDMIGQVDAVLLARDDAKNHFEMSKPFLNAGLPVFIDKPIALTLTDLKAIFNLEQYPGQIFSCSAMRFAREMQLTSEDYKELGEIRHIFATVPKKWETYAVHMIEPALLAIRKRSPLKKVTSVKIEDKCVVTVGWSDGPSATFATLGRTACPLAMTIYGEKSFKNFIFQDTFSAFKASLEAFVNSIQLRRPLIPPKDLETIVEIIERGASWTA